MNYYEPRIAPVWFGGGGQAGVAAVAGQANLLNTFLLGPIYAAFGIPVADVAGAFALTNSSVVDGMPVNVQRVCAWTWMCAGPPHGPDIHANNEGYGVIARAFLPHL
jgi:hypothetical protein